MSQVDVNQVVSAIQSLISFVFALSMFIIGFGLTVVLAGTVLNFAKLKPGLWPMAGPLELLEVAAAFGIVAYVVTYITRLK